MLFTLPNGIRVIPEKMKGKRETNGLYESYIIFPALLIQKQMIKRKMSVVTQEIKGKADEVYHGDEIGLPNGLLPLKHMEQRGIVRDTGFSCLT